MILIIRFEDILAWQETRTMVRDICQITHEGSSSTDFGLRDKIQRAAVSVMAHIAEGFDCESHGEFVRFPGIAHRSVLEVQSLVYAA